MDVTVQEAKTHLSKLLRRVEAGEEITILRGRDPVAVLMPAPSRSATRQIWGDLDGEMAPDFDEPLPEFGEYS